MPQSDNQPEAQAEATAQAPDADAALDAALDKAGVDIERKAIQDAAAAEEKHAAEMLARSRATQAEAEEKPAQEESLVSIMAKGRENLLQRMREHAAATQAKKDEYRPPALTERQIAIREAEQEAGRRARERHEAQAAARPAPVKEKWDGTNTPVFRPGGNVPDPTVPAHSGFAAGQRQYGPDA